MTSLGRPDPIRDVRVPDALNKFRLFDASHASKTPAFGAAPRVFPERALARVSLGSHDRVPAVRG
jgi:hypothetical protein